MTSESGDVIVQVAGARDVAALASLRSLGSGRAERDHDFEQRMAAWCAAEGDRRTTWLATVGDALVGMATMLEYRRMPRPGRPDSRWGYVGNMFVREGFRNRGIGSLLLSAIITAAEELSYERLVLSPTLRSLPFYQRAGFVVPDEAAGDDRLLVRPCRPGT
jgi:GNAT superfamily N-acetyltransferase